MPGLRSDAMRLWKLLPWLLIATSITAFAATIYTDLGATRRPEMPSVVRDGIIDRQAFDIDRQAIDEHEYYEREMILTRIEQFMVRQQWYIDAGHTANGYLLLSWLLLALAFAARVFTHSSGTKK